MTNRRRRVRTRSAGTLVFPAPAPVTLREQVTSANDCALMVIAAIDAGTDATDALRLAVEFSLTAPSTAGQTTAEGVLGAALADATCAYAVALAVIAEQRGTDAATAAAFVLEQTPS